MPTQVLKITSLVELSMTGCGLTGELSDDVFDSDLLPALEKLYLYDNEFHGSIPESIGSISTLRYLSLAQNAFEGEIPHWLKRMDNLQALSLQDQLTKGGGLTGEMPSFSRAPSLTMIMLADNKLSGHVPGNLLDALTNRASTITVDLRNNRITGRVPGDLSRFSHMNLYLEGNEIRDIDDELCEMRHWMSGLVAEYDCDAILCPVNTEGGRQVYEDLECDSCSDGSSDFFGQLQCGNS